MISWPESAEELERLQRELAERGLGEVPWTPGPERLAVAGVFAVVTTRQTDPLGSAGDRAWAAAALLEGSQTTATATARGETGDSYHPGLLALQRGALLESAVRALDRAPDVLLVNGTGRDHPRRAGLALHLGAALDVPTVGATDRPLAARLAEPGPEAGDAAPLILDDELVEFAVRARAGVRPVIAHAGWRTSAETARDLVAATAVPARTPEPLRRARRLARLLRALDEGRLGARS